MSTREQCRPTLGTLRECTPKTRARQVPGGRSCHSSEGKTLTSAMAQVLPNGTIRKAARQMSSTSTDPPPRRNRDTGGSRSVRHPALLIGWPATRTRTCTWPDGRPVRCSAERREPPEPGDSHRLLHCRGRGRGLGAGGQAGGDRQEDRAAGTGPQLLGGGPRRAAASGCREAQRLR